MSTAHQKMSRMAAAGLLTNAALVAVKLSAGLIGNSYALVADAIESSLDVFASLIVWRAIQVASRPPDEDYPYGYGRAESLAASVVSMMLLVAALGIGISSIREILTPHHSPAPFTLVVLVLVIVVKETLFRTVFKVSQSTRSVSLESDAWHHRSDALTSAAAFVGILVSLVGGPGWAAADDWAALLAAFVIGANGTRLLRQAARDLMDRQPPGEFSAQIEAVARGVPGIERIEKLRLRRMGTQYQVDIHAQADGNLSLRAAHDLAGALRGTLREQVPEVLDVLVHMEPVDGASNRSNGQD